jgi:ParB-like chromosome segregation protein Spo0J
MALKQRVKNEFFDESTADHKVIESLIRELRRKDMSVVKTVDGKFYRVGAEQEVSQEEVNAEVAKLQAELAELESVVAPVQPEVPTTVEAPATPEQPVEPAVEVPTQPATPEVAVVDPNAVNLS